MTVIWSALRTADRDSGRDLGRMGSSLLLTFSTVVSLDTSYTIHTTFACKDSNKAQDDQRLPTYCAQPRPFHTTPRLQHVSGAPKQVRVQLQGLATPPYPGTWPVTPGTHRARAPWMGRPGSGSFRQGPPCPQEGDSRPQHHSSGLQAHVPRTDPATPLESKLHVR